MFSPCIIPNLNMRSFTNLNNTLGADFDDPVSSRTIHSPMPVLESGITIMPEWIQAVLTAGNILILVFAFCGNVAAICIVSHSKLSRSSTKWFLITLAISDLMLAISSVPIDLGSVTSKFHEWVFGEFICETASFIQVQAVMMNAFCLFSIALERYMAVITSIKAPILSPKWESRLPYIALACIWIIPTGTSVPTLFAYDHWSYFTATEVNGSLVIYNDTYYYACMQKPDEVFQAVFYCTVGFVFFALLTGFLFCYLSIIHFVHTHGNNFRRNHADEPSAGTEGQSQGSTSGTGSASTVSTLKSHKNRHRRTIRLIMCLILIFFVCRTPVWIFVIVSNTKKLPINEVNLSSMYFLHLVSNISTALSPFVYAIWNDSLRSTGSSVPGKDRQRNVCCCFSFMNGSSPFLITESFGALFTKNGKGNTYDFASQSKVFPSNATQKYFVNDTGEFTNRKSININQVPP